jgi:hypothetical protein
MMLAVAGGTLIAFAVLGVLRQLARRLSSLCGVKAAASRH